MIIFFWLPPKIAEAYETVLRVAIKFGCEAAIKKMKEYPKICGFSQYLNLQQEEWPEIQKWVQNNFEFHLKNRFGYLRDGRLKIFFYNF